MFHPVSRARKPIQDMRSLPIDIIMVLISIIKFDPSLYIEKTGGSTVKPSSISTDICAQRTRAAT
jgi:hypothetical protein